MRLLGDSTAHNNYIILASKKVFDNICMYIKNKKYEHLTKKRSIITIIVWCVSFPLKNVWEKCCSRIYTWFTN